MAFLTTGIKKENARDLDFCVKSGYSVLGVSLLEGPLFNKPRGRDAVRSLQTIKHQKYEIRFRFCIATVIGRMILIPSYFTIQKKVRKRNGCSASCCLVCVRLN